VLHFAKVATYYIFACVAANDAVGLVVLVKRRIWYAWRRADPGLTAEVGWRLLLVLMVSESLGVRLVGVVLSEPGFLSFLLHCPLLLFDFFFAVFLGNLHLKSIFHFLLLGFSLVLNDVLFIATDEDVSTPLKLHIHAIFGDSTANLKVWEVIFSLHWRVLRVSQGRRRVVLREICRLILKVVLGVLIDSVLVRHLCIVLGSHA
jgi:hypothetical protein